MDNLHPAIRKKLVYAIAAREGNAREISNRFGRGIDWLKWFVEENKEELSRLREQIEREGEEVSPSQLGDLWITQKAERLARYQQIADLLFSEIIQGSRDAATLREYRSYSAMAANELGQLLHRGSGESGAGDTVSYEIPGVDLENLR